MVIYISTLRDEAHAFQPLCVSDFLHISFLSLRAAQTITGLKQGVFHNLFSRFVAGLQRLLNCALACFE